MNVLSDLPSLLITGLGAAASLFIMAAGLSIIFGVSRVYNFAHGSLYMLGAYFAYSIQTMLPPRPLWFLVAMLLAAAGVGLVGLVMEIAIMRRIYTAPHHLQIIATFGVFMIIRDVVMWVWGPTQLLAPSIAGLSAPVTILGQRFPSYYLVMFAVSLLILALLVVIFSRTRWGVLLRAAITDREMVAALGVNQKLLFTTVFVLSAALAGLAGGLDTLRVSASLDMDVNQLITVFAVVVIGGMGSIAGSFLAAILIGLLSALGTAYLPDMSLALVFIAMAVILLLRPRGFFGRAMGGGLEEHVGDESVLRLAGGRQRLVWAVLLAALVAVPFVVGPYWTDTVAETLIYVLFAWTFYLLAGIGGMVSLGHAAYFGIGVYGPALLFKYFAVPMTPSLVLAPVLAGGAAALIGAASVRLVGIYFGMLTLALGQILWSVAYQWMDLTNGELGIIGLWPDGWASDRHVFYYLVLGVVVGGVLLMRHLVFSPFGYVLRATRDSAGRADAIGICAYRQRGLAFTVAGALAGLAGVLMVYLKGGAFPSYLDLRVSLDVFIMALLGGLQSLDGPIIGAVIYNALKTVLQTSFPHWNLLLGLLLILLALFLPRGISGAAGDLRGWRARRLATAVGAAPAPDAMPTLSGGH